MNVVITGASRGIGKATARVFATHGYDLYLCSKNEVVLNGTINELKKDFPNITIEGIAADLGNKQATVLFGQWVAGRTDNIDVLVNNAGSFIQGNVSDEPEGALETMISVNLYSAYHLTRVLLPRMIKNRNGHIFTLCSVASLAAYPNGGAYSISKFALLGFTKNLRKEMMPHNIKVTAVIPGAAYTDSWNGSGVAPSRLMEAEDVARAIYQATLFSPQAVVEEIIIRPLLGDL